MIADSQKYHQYHQSHQSHRMDNDMAIKWRAVVAVAALVAVALGKYIIHKMDQLLAVEQQQWLIQIQFALKWIKRWNEIAASKNVGFNAPTITIKCGQKYDYYNKFGGANSWHTMKLVILRAQHVYFTRTHTHTHTALTYLDDYWLLIWTLVLFFPNGYHSFIVTV